MSTSLFEIVGPVMLGPSSSHTAGMARIGVMAHRIAGFIPRAITLRLSPTLSTTYRGHRTDYALIGGAIGWGESDPRLRNTLEEAEKAGISIGYAFYPRNVVHPNTAQLEMVSPEGLQVNVRGVSIGGGSLIIDAIDGDSITLEADRYHIVLFTDGSADLSTLALPSGAQLQAGEKVTALSMPDAPDPALVSALEGLPGVSRLRLVEPVLGYGATVSERLRFTSCEELADYCKNQNLTLPQLAADYESDRSGRSAASVRALMLQQLEVMKESVRRGLECENQMLYGLTDGKDAKRLQKVWAEGKSISGGIVPGAIAKAIGVMEYNASMGCIVAAPTAGSAGIVPGCLVMLQEAYGFSDDRIVDAMLVAAMLGVVMAHRDVSFSGSVGGCQGEVGVSSGIAAAGIASLFSDDPQVPMQAMAMAIKNVTGLACDTIAGPVEVPCIKRNAMGVANAFAAAEMACAGIVSYLPPDQVLDALRDAEKRLPCELRATTVGGLASAEKAVELRKKLAAELVKLEEP